MRIAGKDIDYFGFRFSHALSNGGHYMLYNPGTGQQSLSRDQVRFFIDKSSAERYGAIRNILSNEQLETAPTAAVLGQLNRKMELQQVIGSPVKQPVDITIDTNLIHFQEKARQEIFLKEIAGQLK